MIDTQHTFSFIPKIDPIAYKFNKIKRLLNDSWTMNLRNPKKTVRFRRYESLCTNEDLLTMTPPPLPSGLKFTDYQFPTRKKQMFDEQALAFIKETTARDLLAVKQKIEQVIHDLARLGKNLSDLKATEAKLESIMATIKEDEEDDDYGCESCR